MAIALWIIGPSGSGKSRFLDRQLPANFHRIDPDPEFEAALIAKGLPLDMRKCDEEQLAAIDEVRSDVADEIWDQLPRLRARRVPLAFATTGNKPHLLREQAELGAAAGYVSIGVGLRRPLDVCLAQNTGRTRIVPESLVRSTWCDFELNLTNRVYESILGAGRFCCPEDPEQFVLQQWLELIGLVNSIADEICS